MHLLPPCFFPLPPALPSTTIYIDHSSFSSFLYGNFPLSLTVSLRQSRSVLIPPLDLHRRKNNDTDNKRLPTRPGPGWRLDSSRNPLRHQRGDRFRSMEDTRPSYRFRWLPPRRSWVPTVKPSTFPHPNDSNSSRPHVNTSPLPDSPLPRSWQVVAQARSKKPSPTVAKLHAQAPMPSSSSSPVTSPAGSARTVLQ